MFSIILNELIPGSNTVCALALQMFAEYGAGLNHRTKAGRE